MLLRRSIPYTFFNLLDAIMSSPGSMEETGDNESSIPCCNPISTEADKSNDIINSPKEGYIASIKEILSPSSAKFILNELYHINYLRVADALLPIFNSTTIPLEEKRIIIYYILFNEGIDGLDSSELNRKVQKTISSKYRYAIGLRLSVDDDELAETLKFLKDFCVSFCLDKRLGFFPKLESVNSKLILMEEKLNDILCNLIKDQRHETSEIEAYLFNLECFFSEVNILRITFQDTIEKLCIQHSTSNESASTSKNSGESKFYIDRINWELENHYYENRYTIEMAINEMSELYKRMSSIDGILDLILIEDILSCFEVVFAYIKMVEFYLDLLQYMSLNKDLYWNPNSKTALVNKILNVIIGSVAAFPHELLGCDAYLIGYATKEKILALHSLVNDESSSKVIKREIAGKFCKKLIESNFITIKSKETDLSNMNSGDLREYLIKIQFLKNYIINGSSENEADNEHEKMVDEILKEIETSEKYIVEFLEKFKAF